VVGWGGGGCWVSSDICMAARTDLDPPGLAPGVRGLLGQMLLAVQRRQRDQAPTEALWAGKPRGSFLPLDAPAAELPGCLDEPPHHIDLAADHPPY